MRRSVPRTGCTARESTSTPTCRVWTPSAVVCRLSSRPGSSRVLGHYGVTDSERSTELEEAVFRIFLAQQRSTPDVLLVTSVLQRWIAETRPAATLDEAAHELLDRLVLATQLRFPVIGDLARSVRFRWYDQPLVDAERASVLAGVSDEVAALAVDPAAPNRKERIDALASIPEPIVRFLAQRLEYGWGEQEPMLEVLIRRHYREYELHDLREFAVGGRPFATADYSIDDRLSHLVTTVGTVAELADPDSGLVAGADRTGRQPPSRTRGRRRAVPARSGRARGAAGGVGPPPRPGRRSARLPAGTALVRRDRTGSGSAGLVLHLPPRRRLGDRGRQRPRRAPDGRPAADPVAAARLPDHPAGRARGRAALPLRRP